MIMKSLVARFSRRDSQLPTVDRVLIGVIVAVGLVAALGVIRADLAAHSSSPETVRTASR
jgi:Flp pilus assembly pilin Flp